MKINTCMITSDPWYQRYDFVQFLEHHLPRLREKISRVQHVVDGHTGQKYRGDFYGLCATFGISADLQYVVMRLNRLFNPTDYNGEPMTIITPLEEEVGLLRNVFRTVEK